VYIYFLISYVLISHYCFQAREKDLLKKIAELQKIIEELKEQIVQKDEIISSLETQLKEQVYF
jgi:predicted  nucleic acid-binding Zn-ribbon protein